jgi:predicted ATPase/class 3 adenylate cyclase
VTYARTRPIIDHVRQLPTGTVTLLFTDIEGSTRLLHELGDRYADVLAEHRRALRSVFECHGGVEVDTQGDAFFVAFSRAADALAAAGEAQRTLEPGPVRVRMGIHSGDPTVTDEGYVGLDVHRAARICATAHGGQTVVSETTRALLDDDPELIDLGLHRLKDLTEPVKLFQLGAGEFSPLRSLNATNLPALPSPLVGRERELRDILELLHSTRLLTLTGAGGSGKTRLALQAAAELVDEFKDGVFWVSLVPVTDPELVLPSVAATLGARDELARFIDEKRLLLLLDNAEHVLACAPGLGELLRCCPNLKLLVTSREPLRLGGEQRYEVPPLADAEAVELFTQRAREVLPAFEPDSAVGEICRRLDGLPLALELAAARVKLLTPRQILERLVDRFRLLVTGPRDAPERQRTLRSTIEWSYELLGDDERQLFAHCGVFAGSFDLEAAEKVADADLEVLASLVDKSLVRRSGNGRFFMLETIREYALRRLEESGEAPLRRRKHAAFFCAGAELAAPGLFRGDQTLAVMWFEQETANLRAALEWAEAHDEGLELRLVAAVVHFWNLRGHWSEADRWIDRTLGVAEPAPARARLLQEAALLARLRRDFPQARALAQQSLQLHQRLGDSSGAARCLNTLSAVAGFEGDWHGARRLSEESKQLALSVDDVRTAGFALFSLADAGLFLGKYDESWRSCGEALQLFRRIDNGEGMALALAVAAFAAAATNRRSEAKHALREALTVSAELRFPEPLSWCLDAAATFAPDYEAAARLLGAAEHLREGLPARPTVERIHERRERDLSRALGTQRLEALRAQGAEMELEKAVAYALGALDRTTGS